MYYAVSIYTAMFSVCFISTNAYFKLQLNYSLPNGKKTTFLSPLSKKIKSCNKVFVCIDVYLSVPQELYVK